MAISEHISVLMRAGHTLTGNSLSFYVLNGGKIFRQIAEKYGYGQPDLEEDVIPGLVRLVLRFDIKDTSNDEEIIADAFHLEEGYERRFVQKMSEVLDPNKFLKMMSLIEYLELHVNIVPKKLPKLLAGLLPQ